jgi:hypothetical protein
VNKNANASKKKKQSNLPIKPRCLLQLEIPAAENQA